MEILPDRPTTKASADLFTGDAWFDQIVRGESPSRIRAPSSASRPAPATRGMSTPSGQTLHVTDGRRPDPGARRRRPGDPGRGHDPDGARGVALARRCAGPVHDPRDGLRGGRRRRRDRVGRPGARRRLRRAAGPERADERLDARGARRVRRSGRDPHLVAAARRHGAARRSRSGSPGSATTSTSARRTARTTAGTGAPGRRARARIQVGGLRADVAFEDADPAVVEPLHAAYHAKYDRYGARIVNTVVSDEAAAATLRVVPRARTEAAWRHRRVSGQTLVCWNRERLV